MLIRSKPVNLGNVKINFISKDNSLLKDARFFQGLKIKAENKTLVNMYLFKKDDEFVIEKSFFRIRGLDNGFCLWQDKRGDNIFVKMNDPYAIHNAVFVSLLLKHNFILHSSCVMDKNKLGILFIGYSGSGKSTLANSLLGLDFIHLADDLSIIYQNNKGSGVFCRSCPTDKGYKKDDVCNPCILVFPSVIHKENSALRTLSKKESFFRLLAYFPNGFIFTKDITRSYLSLLWHLASQSCSYELDCGRDIKYNPKQIVKLLKLENGLVKKGGKVVKKE